MARLVSLLVLFLAIVQGAWSFPGLWVKMKQGCLSHPVHAGEMSVRVQIAGAQTPGYPVNSLHVASMPIAEGRHKAPTLDRCAVRRRTRRAVAAPLLLHAARVRFMRPRRVRSRQPFGGLQESSPGSKLGS
jgi:hypothetical protein